MLKLAVEKYKNLKIDDIEIKENRKLFAVDAFEVIHKSDFVKNVDKENIFLIMGSDNYSKMPNWKNYDKIKDKYNYIVINRDKNQISSTKIREMIKDHDKKVMTKSIVIFDGYNKDGKRRYLKNKKVFASPTKNIIDESLDYINNILCSQ